MQTQDTRETLPDLSRSIASLVPEHQRDTLLATILFHPDADRIGESAELAELGQHVTFELGRLQPLFARVGGPSRPLLEDYISRRALELRLHGQELALSRPQGASRSHLMGRELDSEPRLVEAAELARGAIVSLSHGVLLLLHSGTRGVADSAEGDFGELLGNSPAMRELRRQLRRAAAAETDVLIRGETGTGKELVARALHRESPRSGGPLVVVNMAAIPAGVAAASLFGAQRGAFTGADRAMTGYFQQAEGGTLFLDEVGDTPLEVQPQLLRALQQREIQPVGGAVKRVDVRIVSATDIDLESADTGFRSALMYRLGAEELFLPALRDRPEDIPLLLLRFLAREFGALGLADRLPGPDSPRTDLALWSQLFYRLQRHSWPGNVRELENAARSIALASEDGLVLPRSLYRRLRGDEKAVAEPRDSLEPVPARPLSDYEDSELQGVLRNADFEIAAAARALRVSRQSLYRRIDRSPLMRLAVDIPLEEMRDTLRACRGDEQAAASRLQISVAGLRGRMGREPGRR